MFEIFRRFLCIELEMFRQSSCFVFETFLVICVSYLGFLSISVLHVWDVSLNSVALVRFIVNLRALRLRFFVYPPSVAFAIFRWSLCFVFFRFFVILPVFCLLFFVNLRVWDVLSICVLLWTFCGDLCISCSRFFVYLRALCLRLKQATFPFCKVLDLPKHYRAL